MNANAVINHGVYSLISIVNPGMKTLKRNIFICLSDKVSQDVPKDIRRIYVFQTKFPMIGIYVFQTKVPKIGIYVFQTKLPRMSINDNWEYVSKKKECPIVKMRHSYFV